MIGPNDFDSDGCRTEDQTIKDLIKSVLKNNLEIEIERKRDYDGSKIVVKLKFDGEQIAESSYYV